MGGYGFIRFSLPMFPDASAVFRAPRLRAVGHRHHLHLAGRADAGGHEEADRLFVGRPYGLRDHGHLRMNHAGRAGRDLPDAVPRHRLRRALPLRRRGLRPHAHPRDRRLWRAGQPHAEICGGASWSSPWPMSACPALGFVGEFLTLLGVFRVNTWVAFFADHRRDPVGGLRALALPPGDLRRADQASLKGIARPRPRART